MVLIWKNIILKYFELVSKIISVNALFNCTACAGKLLQVNLAFIATEVEILTNGAKWVKPNINLLSPYFTLHTVSQISITHHVVYIFMVSSSPLISFYFIIIFFRYFPLTIWQAMKINLQCVNPQALYARKYSVMVVIVVMVEHTQSRQTKIKK